MAKKTYEVKTRIETGKEPLVVGDVVELDERVGAPLVDAGALVEQLKADKAAK